MRRSLIVIGTAAVALVLGLVGLFWAGGGGTPRTGRPPTLPTTTSTSLGPRTTTTIIALSGPQGTVKRFVVHLVAVPNVVGMTVAQAEPALSAVGLSLGAATPATEPSESQTGTIVAQAPGSGSRSNRDR